MTTLSRRHFLTLAASTFAATGCRGVVSAEFSEIPDTDPSVQSPAETATTVDRLLERAGYGAPPAERARANQLGLRAYLEEQLNPNAIADDATLPALIETRSSEQLIQLERKQGRAAIDAFLTTTVSHALLSKRQVYEAMVEFWSDHFHIFVGKNQTAALLKITNDRDVIRPNALGNFRDLLYASATSPAMLYYLDNVQNRKGKPNENYARELLELHTLGVDGGYDETDVKEVARVLTGWSIRSKRQSNAGEVLFRAGQHDQGEKRILGTRFPPQQGADDLTQLVDLLATHPSTARFIATKLCRRFVADDPPSQLVTRVSETFLSTGGGIKSMLRVIFHSRAFATAPTKLKRPYSYFVSSLRTLGIQLDTLDIDVAQILTLLGQVPFYWPAPNGYPDVAAAWANKLLPRWNFALLLAQKAKATSVLTGDETVTQLERTLLTRPLDAQARKLFEEVGNSAEPEARTRLLVALMLAHPVFQTT